MGQLIVFLGCRGVLNKKEPYLPPVCHACEDGHPGSVPVPLHLYEQLFELLIAGDGGVAKFIDAHSGEFAVKPCPRGGERFLTSSVRRIEY